MAVPDNPYRSPNTELQESPTTRTQKFGALVCGVFGWFGVVFGALGAITFSIVFAITTDKDIDVARTDLLKLAVFALVSCSIPGVLLLLARSSFRKSKAKQATILFLAGLLLFLLMQAAWPAFAPVKR